MSICAPMGAVDVQLTSSGTISEFCHSGSAKTHRDGPGFGYGVERVRVERINRVNRKKAIQDSGISVPAYPVLSTTSHAGR